jgi:hypothetical protein
MGNSSSRDADVFAIIGDPQYNALRLHLMIKDQQDSHLKFEGGERKTSRAEDKNADLVRTS